MTGWPGDGLACRSIPDREGLTGLMEFVPGRQPVRNSMDQRVV